MFVSGPPTLRIGYPKGAQRMAIYKIKRRKGVVYRVRLMIQGKRASKNFARKIDAIHFQEQAKLDDRVVENIDFTFGEASEEWLINHAEVRKAPKSVATDRQMLQRNLLPRFGKMALNRISPELVDRMILEMKRTGASDSTINRNLEVMRAIYYYCIKRRKTQFNPVSAVGLFKVQLPPIVFWTKEEADKFLRYVEAKYEGTRREIIAFLYKFALNSGMRMGEILALSWHEVDIENRLITVRRSFDSYERRIRERTKSGRIRHVPINSALYEELSVMKKKRVHELVFTVDGKPLDRSNLTFYFQRDSVEAGVRKIRFHDMRHTYASHFMMNGGDMYHLKEILGHADMTMTQRYAHLSRSFLVDKADTVCFTTKDNVINLEFKKCASV
jgi:integrase